ncbi:MAG: histidinol-phosphate transaminase [Myxococcota bacterium]
MARRIVSQTLLDLKAYEAGKPIEEVERELGIKNPVKLASNENAYGPSPKAVEAVKHAIAKVHLYPDAAGHALRHALAGFVGLDPEWIVLGNGSNEILSLVVRTFVQPDDNVVGSAGSFIAYKIVTRAADRSYREAPLGHDLGYDLDAMAALVDEKTRVVFVANPNNPTGSFIDAPSLARFIAAVDAKAGPDGPPVIVLDEAYVEFIDHPDPPDALAILRHRPRTIVTRTFSKAYGLAGLRVGYAALEPELANYLNRVREPFNVNLLGQVAALAALDDRAWVQSTSMLIRAERTRLAELLRAIGVDVAPSQGNFVLVEVGDAAVVHQALMRKGFIARPMGAGGLPRHLRVTVGRPEENEGFVRALGEVLGH